MFARFLVPLILCWPTVLLAQVNGNFYLQKESFAPGEPVFLYFDVTNSGTETVNIYRADPYSFCSGYQINVSTDAPSDSTCPTLKIGSCISSDGPLKPGDTLTERILLNFKHSINSPGDYSVDVEGNFSYAPASEDFFRASKSLLDVHAHLNFRVDENVVGDPAELQGWVDQLHSEDPSRRRDAARTLASLAPKSLEDILLTFADNPEFKEWAPLALQRLNTPRSLAALAKLLDMEQPGTYVHMEAAQFLAESGHPEWFSTPLDVAKKNSRIAAYTNDAAEIGGDQSLPFLLPMLMSSDIEFTRPVGISALGYTGSRAAVPVLISVLRSSDLGTARRALTGLRQLTHRDIGGKQWFADPQSQYLRWLSWWNREGASAPIYKGCDCGETKPLR